MAIESFFVANSNQWKREPFIRHRRNYVVLSTSIIFLTIVGASPTTEGTLNWLMFNFSRPEYVFPLMMFLLIYFSWRYSQFSPNLKWSFHNINSKFLSSLVVDERFQILRKVKLIDYIEKRHGCIIKQFHDGQLKGNIFSLVSEYSGLKWNKEDAPRGELSYVEPGVFVIQLRFFDALDITHFNLIKVMYEDDTFVESIIPHISGLAALITFVIR